MPIEQADSRAVAAEIRRRYEPLRAVTLIGRAMVRALFDGRSDDVVFWAVVHAHYRGSGATDRASGHLEKLVESAPSNVAGADEQLPLIRQRRARRV